MSEKVINNEKEMILNDNLWKIMIKLAWPAVIAMVLYGLNTVFDAIFVGRFVSEDALAGVSIAYPLTQIVIGFGSLIGVGAGSALSIAIGSNDHEKQRKLLGNSNYMALISCVVFMIIALLFGPSFVKLMGGTGDILKLGSAYFRVTAFGSIFWILGLTYNMIIRAEGKMKSAAAIMGIGLLVNLCANYLFVVILKFGVEGAAWGTNLGMLVYTVIGLIYFRDEKASFDAKPFSISRDKEIIKEIISMGMPSFIMTIMSLIQAFIVLNAISKFGTSSDLAFYGATFRIFTFVLTPIFGLMRALQPVIGINFGANKNLRVIKSYKIYSLASIILVLPFWLFMMIAPELTLSAMLPSKVLSIQDIFNFRVFMSALPFMPFVFMGMTFFPAINKGKPAAMIGIARQVVFYIPVMLILPRMYGIQWIYIGSMAIDVIITLWTTFLVRKEFTILRKDIPKLESKAV